MNAPATTGVRLEDRVNPILVKEVRQALRGKYFRVLFWITLLVGTLIGVGIVSAIDEISFVETGRVFFMAIFGVLSAAVHCFVPFSAFLATSAEWDENTYDLLIISNLRPRQIVQGKLLSALIQALLYYSAFGPFLVFAFLLNGIDLGSVGVILAGSVATSVALTFVGIAASSLATNKVMRVVLMALFGAGLIAAWGMSMGLAAGITFEPQVLSSIEGQVAFVAYLTVAVVVALLAQSIALGRFAHEEENRSTPLRVMSTVLVLFASAWGAWLVQQFGDSESIFACHSGAAALLFFPWLISSTEPEELGRRASAVGPKGTLATLLSAPFLPGGGRAATLCFLQALLAVVTSQIALGFTASRALRLDNSVLAVAALYAYLLAYTVLPAGVAAYFVQRRSARVLLRILMVVAIPVGIVIPAMLSMFFGSGPGSALSHPLNPFSTLYDIQFGAPSPFTYAVLGLALLLALLVNAPRVFAGLREVLRARASRVQQAEDAPRA
ncbi:MAG: hypothetical protein FJ294_02975 [Planctomycetes bacterium]|nr:hypothetical protein [Planctomycetota bacterium]MBM3990374.1 hypothetical protein [Planctomycetota bacterium]